MKKIVTGWIGKTVVKNPSKICGYGSGIDLLGGVFRTKGRKNEWDESDWPPVKVRVTVETVD